MGKSQATPMNRKGKSGISLNWGYRPLFVLFVHLALSVILAQLAAAESGAKPQRLTGDEIPQFKVVEKFYGTLEFYQELGQETWDFNIKSDLSYEPGGVCATILAASLEEMKARREELARQPNQVTITLEENTAQQLGRLRARARMLGHIFGAMRVELVREGCTLESIDRMLETSRGSIVISRPDITDEPFAVEKVAQDFFQAQAESGRTAGEQEQ